MFYLLIVARRLSSTCAKKYWNAIQTYNALVINFVLKSYSQKEFFAIMASQEFEAGRSLII